MSMQHYQSPVYMEVSARDGTEHCDAAGALALKTRIESYWAERGYRVQCMLVLGQFCQAARASRLDVRSDMRNGLPADWSAR